MHTHTHTRPPAPASCCSSKRCLPTCRPSNSPSFQELLDALLAIRSNLGGTTPPLARYTVRRASFEHEHNAAGRVAPVLGGGDGAAAGGAASGGGAAASGGGTGGDTNAYFGMMRVSPERGGGAERCVLHYPCPANRFGGLVQIAAATSQQLCFTFCERLAPTAAAW